MKILCKLENLSNDNDVQICWVPSHTGISGKDEAVKVAKSTLNITSETAINLINYWKLHPHWEDGNKTTGKSEKRMLYYPDFVLVIQEPHILTYLKQSSYQWSCMLNQIH